MNLYHSAIGLPRGWRAPVGRFTLTYTHHAKEAAQTDKRLPGFFLPNVIDVRYARIIEVGMEGRKTAKILYRLAYTNEFDICIVVIPGAKFVVKTVWLQDVNDDHATLDRSKYVAV